jgi:hypothetical protein
VVVLEQVPLQVLLVRVQQVEVVGLVEHLVHLELQEHQEPMVQVEPQVQQDLLAPLVQVRLVELVEAQVRQQVVVHQEVLVHQLHQEALV